ncbi:MAG: putative toxin-antitoxin system toxin component, PIN family [Candidatus Latescibacteria bacterium]|nr:putative toxin-antitoxin system toxin component, PIN family [Candidatus Latescibacterota bacterium]OPX25542.1 MAG: putative toxin-antitoxin system toxin component, PIN family [Candidatus Latescibacteria bacterium 4484_107]
MTIETSFRAVFDTNVYVAWALGKNPRSPIKELFERLKHGEFVLLYSMAIRDEVIEKLFGKGLSGKRIAGFVEVMTGLGEEIVVEPEEVEPVILADPDDDVVLTCASKGKATHLVTYDSDFDVLGGVYQGITILDGLHFLYVLRGDSEEL